MAKKKPTNLKPCHFCKRPTGRRVTFGNLTFAVPCCSKCEHPVDLSPGPVTTRILRRQAMQPGPGVVRRISPTTGKVLEEIDPQAPRRDPFRAGAWPAKQNPRPKPARRPYA